MRSCKLLLTVGLLSLLVGCNQVSKVSIPERKEPIQRVVSLSPSTTELIADTNDSELLAGRTQSCDYPTGLDKVPIVCSVKPDYEKIAQVKPQVIVYDSSLFAANEVEKLKQIPGAQVFEFKSTDLKTFYDSLARLGAAIGGERRYSEYADKIQKAINTAAALKTNPPAKIAILMGDEGEALYWDGVDSFRSQLLKEIGAEPVGAAGSQFVPANIEALIAANPDSIITTGKSQAILNDPRLKSIKAVQSGKVFALNPDAVLRAGSRIDKFVLTLGQIAWTNVVPPKSE
jgi:ABC-type Fe3+-hydroxamate transport system substrate-binding protein